MIIHIQFFNFAYNGASVLNINESQDFIELINRTFLENQSPGGAIVILVDYNLFILRRAIVEYRLLGEGLFLSIDKKNKIIL